MRIRERISNGDLSVIQTCIGPAPLILSYDMGWQKRAEGCVYDSLNGHGFLIDCRSKKVIHFFFFKCSIYQQYNKQQEEIPTHRCNVNHEGSSGSMESALALTLCEEICIQIQG